MPAAQRSDRGECPPEWLCTTCPTTTALRSTSGGMYVGVLCSTDHCGAGTCEHARSSNQNAAAVSGAAHCQRWRCTAAAMPRK